MSSKILHVFICGAHSSGKTTLVKELQKCLKMDSCCEVARNVIRQLEINVSNILPKTHPTEFANLQVEILKKAVESIQLYRDRNTVFDRGIDPLVYLRYYCGETVYEEGKNSINGVEIIERSRQSLVFVVFPHPVCNKSDGVRLEPVLSEQVEFVQTMINVLDENQISFVPIVRLDLNKRVEEILVKVAEQNADLLNDFGLSILNRMR